MYVHDFVLNVFNANSIDKLWSYSFDSIYLHADFKIELGVLLHGETRSVVFVPSVCKTFNSEKKS